MGKARQLKRVAVLTGGGDCPGINAVIRAAVKTAVKDYGLETYGVEDGYDGLVQNRMRPLSYDDVSGILTVGGTVLGASNKANPFRYYEPGKQDEEPADRSEESLENFRKAGLDALICIGGDGTLSIAHRLAQKGIPLVGVPKTIDNDVCETDVTFGFDTAVQIVSDAIDRLHTTAQSHHRVMIVEAMGRYSGWLALGGGLAGGGDVILIPEIPYALEKVCEVVRRRSRIGRRFSILVVAEGVKCPSGEYVVSLTEAESHEQLRLGGVGVWLARAIEDQTALSCRACVLGHLQRGGTPTARDRLLATLFGRQAMVEAARGNFRTMVAIQGREMVTVPLSEVAGKQRLVEKDNEMVLAARSVGTSFGDE